MAALGGGGGSCELGTPVRSGGQTSTPSRGGEAEESKEHFRANAAHVRQSRPDSGIDFQTKVLNYILAVGSSL